MLTWERNKCEFRPHVLPLWVFALLARINHFHLTHFLSHIPATVCRLGCPGDGVVDTAGVRNGHRTPGDPYGTRFSLVYPLAFLGESETIIIGNFNRCVAAVICGGSPKGDGGIGGTIVAGALHERTGALVSPTLMVWMQVAEFSHESEAAQVRVMVQD